MNDVTKITFDDNSGKGTLTMYRNPFKNGRRYYARFDRSTITMEQIIARIQKRELGTNALMVQHITGLIKAEILEALSRGEAVNVLGLGTLYITADASAESESTGDVTVAGFSAGFTPSALTNSTLKGLAVHKITVADSGGTIPDDESRWTAVEESLLKVNLARRIEFIIPRELASGSYRILLRTSYAGGAKSLKAVHTVQSDVIRITES